MESIEDLCDKYSKSILDRTGKTIYGGANPVIRIPDEKDLLEYQLEIDGYLKKAADGNYYLTGEGRLFLEDGGYKSLKNRIKEKRELEERQIKSVIRTNNAVLASLIITGAAILGTFYYQRETFKISEKEYDLHIKQIAPIKPTLTVKTKESNLKGIDTSKQ